MGLALLFTAARHRTSRHDNTKRHGLKQSHRETAAADDERHDLTYLRWRNQNARHPDVLAAQRKERARRIRSEKGIRWGGRPLMMTV